MADLYSNNYNNSEVLKPAVKVEAKDEKGRKVVSYDFHTFDGEITTSDTLFMNKIPKGARVHNVTVISPDLGTTGILNIGHSAGENGDEVADPDAFFAALDVKAAAVFTDLLDTGSITVAGLMKEFSEDVFLTIIPTENTDAADGLTIKVIVEYSIY